MSNHQATTPVHECQYAKDVGMPEYRCAVQCQYATPPAAPAATEAPSEDEQLVATIRYCANQVSPNAMYEYDVASVLSHAADRIAALAAVGASVQPVPESLSDENRSIGRAINRAAAELPPGAQIRIELERDAGTVYWLDQKHGAWRHIDSGGEPFSSQIDAAIDAVLEALATTSSAPAATPKGGE